MANKDRKPIPSATQTRLLVLSRRRCCLCFGLDRDDEQQEGQIAHVDKDRSNNDLENLAFLCLRHHNEYDTKRSQAKNISPEELKYYRSELYMHLKQMQGDPPELALTKKELQTWVKQQQRTTFIWSLSLMTAFLILQAIMTPAGIGPKDLIHAGAPPVLSIESQDKYQNMLPPIAKKPEPKRELERDKGGSDEAQSLAPSGAQPHEDAGVGISSDNTTETSKNQSDSTEGANPDTNNTILQDDCNLTIPIKGHTGQPSDPQPAQPDTVKIRFSCAQRTFNAGDTITSGEITVLNPTVFPMHDQMGRHLTLTSGTTISWQNLGVKYLGDGNFTTSALALSSSKLLSDGGYLISLRPTPPPGFNRIILGGGPGFQLIFVFLTLAIVIAWSSRIAWERHLIHKHHLTVKL